MTQLTCTGPVRVALTITSAAAVVALLGMGSAWAMTPPTSVSGTHSLGVSGSPASHLVILVKSDQDAYPAKYDKAREMMQQGEMEVKEGIADEQKGAAEVEHGMELEREAAELMNPHP
jgi:hypothetical protein